LLAQAAKHCYRVGMETSLDTEVRDALISRKGDWREIAEQSKVSYSWLSKFVNGHIDNPGFGTLKRLHAHLLDPAAGQVEQSREAA
jgi:transcriptional regulator with XRE-family HTH domain